MGTVETVHEGTKVEQLRAELLIQVAQGSDSALAELYDSTSRIVYGLALRITGDPSSSEDILLEVYMQVWCEAGGYDPTRGTVSAWLVTMTRSRAIDWVRSRKAHRRDRERPLEAEPTLLDPRPSPEHASFEAERTRLIRTALGELSAEQRKVIELAYFSGLSHSQVAHQVRLPLGTVKSRIRWGILCLRKLLRSYIEYETRKTVRPRRTLDTMPRL